MIEEIMNQEPASDTEPVHIFLSKMKDKPSLDFAFYMYSFTARKRGERRDNESSKLQCHLTINKEVHQPSLNMTFDNKSSIHLQGITQFLLNKWSNVKYSFKVTKASEKILEGTLRLQTFNPEN